MTSDEFNELLSDAPPSTADDVSITADGERVRAAYCARAVETDEQASFVRALPG